MSTRRMGGREQWRSVGHFCDGLRECSEINQHLTQVPTAASLPLSLSLSLPQSLSLSLSLSLPLPLSTKDPTTLARRFLLLTVSAWNKPPYSTTTSSSCSSAAAVSPACACCEEG